MKIVELSGGVGGARLARGLAALERIELTVVVNVGDDAENHGLYVSPDLDTVIYTLAGVEGPLGWGRSEDTFECNSELARFGLDNTFRLGDRDLALKLFRTYRLAASTPLSQVTESIVTSFDLRTAVIPATDDRLRTTIRIDEGWVSFQEYFVNRGHRDQVLELHFDGAEPARPAPGVLEAIMGADRVVIGPSNPPLSIWPILAIEEVRDAIRDHPSVDAISPLVAGKTVKGPADRVMASLGLPPGNAGVARAYQGLIDRLFIDRSDASDAERLHDVEVVVSDIMIEEPDAARRLAHQLVAS
jgi:LPPG:FO 2-phospho-L-lactate transferase